MDREMLIDQFDMPDGYIKGCLPRTTKLGSEWPVFEDAIDVIPRSEWPDLIPKVIGLEACVGTIHDQLHEGSCTSNAATQCMEIVWNKTYGKDRFVELSPISLYRRVARGPGSGSGVDANLRALKADGILPVNNEANKARFKHTHPPTGYYTKPPEGWKETAAFFKAVEWLDVRSVEGFITALILNFPVCYGRSGHAICGVKPVLKGKSIYVKYANSHGTSSSYDGYGLDSERAVRSGSGYGAWALRVVTMPNAEEILGGKLT